MPDSDPDAPDRLRPMLHGLAEYEQQPPRDALRTAMRRVRARRTDARAVNEVLEAFASLVRGLGRLFGADDVPKGRRE